MYDIFYISKQKDQKWKCFKEKYPLAKFSQSVIEAQQKSLTEFFWIVWDNLNIEDSFDFDYDPDQWSKQYVHVFKNGIYFDGVCLIPKNAFLSSREIDHRFFVSKKEVNLIASVPCYDIVFISYQEPSANENYKKLIKKYPRAKRVHGIKGIHQAHIEAAKMSTTEMLWIVDGDAIIDSNFNFDFQVSYQERDFVHVWRSLNPINDLVYGYGGVKLFPTELTLNMDVSKPDMTTSISTKFRAINKISNITAFNTDPFNTWKSAFRECCKLSSKIIDRQNDVETQERLQIWCSKGEDRSFGKYAIDGAKMGALYGTRNKSDVDKLKMINDFDWLRDQFDARNI
jgi:hypothetical protein